MADMDERGWKCMKMEERRILDKSGWKWMKLDEIKKCMTVYESVWKCMKVDESGW